MYGLVHSSIYLNLMISLSAYLFERIHPASKKHTNGAFWHFNMHDSASDDYIQPGKSILKMNIWILVCIIHLYLSIFIDQKAYLNAVFED